MKLNKNSMNTLLVKSFEIINIFSVFEEVSSKLHLFEQNTVIL